MGRSADVETRSMDHEEVHEGTAPFAIPSINQECQTYYKIFGDLQRGPPPIIVLHGGPGSGHDYLLPFGKLWQRTKLAVILYDQIGSAKSTHIREKAGDTTFWTPDLMVQQLDSLIDFLHLRDQGKPGYYILGHSWGGMLGSYFATRRPRGLKKLILANAPGTADLHVVGLHKCMEELPQETHQVLETNEYESQGYKEAFQVLQNTFWSRADPTPEELLRVEKIHNDDWTVTKTMYGPHPVELSGSLRGWSCIPALPQIAVPTLLYHGEYDIEREEVVAPYMSIPGVRKVTLANASHMSHLDNAELQDKVLELVGYFFLEQELS